MLTVKFVWTFIYHKMLLLRISFAKCIKLKLQPGLSYLTQFSVIIQKGPIRGLAIWGKGYFIPKFFNVMGIYMWAWFYNEEHTKQNKPNFYSII